MTSFEIIILAIVALNTVLICDLWYWFRFRDVPAIVVSCPVAADLERVPCSSEELNESGDWVH